MRAAPLESSDLVDGLPVGVQLVGPPGADEMLLRLGEALEPLILPQGGLITEV